jgi:hypothetical protein
MAMAVSGRLAEPVRARVERAAVAVAAVPVAVPPPVAVAGRVVAVVAVVAAGQGAPDAVDRLVAVAQPELTEPLAATALPELVELPVARPLPEHTEPFVAVQVPEPTELPVATAPPLVWLVVWAPAGPASRPRMPTTPAKAASIDVLSRLLLLVIVIPSLRWMSVGQSGDCGG